MPCYMNIAPSLLPVLFAHVFIRVGARLADAAKVEAQRRRVEVIKHIRSGRTMHLTPVGLDERHVVPPPATVAGVAAVVPSLRCGRKRLARRPDYQ